MVHTTTKCGCSLLILVHQTSEFITSPLSPFTTTNEFTQNPMKSLGVQGHFLL